MPTPAPTHALVSRPLRIEFPGAIHHITSRDDRREPIFLDDENRRALLEVVAHAVQRFDAQALVYCLMGNHYHCFAGSGSPATQRNPNTMINAQPHRSR